MDDSENDLTITARIWLLFVRHKKLSDHCIEQLLPGVNPNSIRPTRLKLERKGWIKRTEEKRTVEGRGEYMVFKLADCQPSLLRG